MVLWVHYSNYIDILLKSEQINIVIENKIYALLYNDLDDYYNSAIENGKEKPIGIVLSLYPQDECNKNFHFVTYDSLFNILKMKLGFYIQNANKKYLPFLNDFLDNIENLHRSNNMDIEFINFIRNHEEEAIDFAAKMENLRKDLRNMVKSVNQLLEEKLNGKNLKIWPWRALPKLYDVAVVDYYPLEDKKLTIAFDSAIDLRQWNFSLWIRTNNTGTNVDLDEYKKNRRKRGSKRRQILFRKKTVF